MWLATGATGHIGNVLVRQLIERGEKVRVLILPDECRARCMKAFATQ
jgi:dihydroflavonol-4-reductase